MTMPDALPTMPPPTPRQLELGRLLIEGGLNHKEIAATLGITISTVKKTIYGHKLFCGLYQRIGARTALEAAHWWWTVGPGRPARRHADTLTGDQVRWPRRTTWLLRSLPARRRVVRRRARVPGRPG